MSLLQPYVNRMLQSWNAYQLMLMPLFILVEVLVITLDGRVLVVNLTFFFTLLIIFNVLFVGHIKRNRSGFQCYFRTL